MKKQLAVISTALMIAASTVNIYAQATDRYFVQPGDTLWEISRKYKVKLDDVIESNRQFKDPNLIYPNDIVIVPIDGGKWVSYGEIGASMSDRGDGSVADNPDHKHGSLSSVKAAASAHEYESKVAELVNVERTRNGASPLALAADLSNVARVKSEDMRDKGYFSHTSGTYGSPFDMMKLFGIKYSIAGENIAKGQKTPQDVVNAWMSSEGHRRNILNPNFKELGVGYVTDQSGTSYWTQQFIAR